jgi:hypothetical protein
VGLKRGQNAAPFPGEEWSSERQQRAREVVAVAPDRASGGRRRPGRLTGRALMSVRGRRRGRLGQKGGGREVGHGWAKRGRERGGPLLSLKGEGERWAAAGPETENG